MYSFGQTGLTHEDFFHQGVRNVARTGGRRNGEC